MAASAVDEGSDFLFQLMGRAGPGLAPCKFNLSERLLLLDVLGRDSLKKKAIRQVLPALKSLAQAQFWLSCTEDGRALSGKTADSPGIFQQARIC